MKLSNSIIFLLALTTGFAVSSIYLIQPLGDTIARALNASHEQVGLIMSLTIIGYGLGIFFLVPLGDILPKKKLILSKLLFLGVALACTGFAPNFEVMLLLSVLIGLSATAAQDVVPFAADLSDEKSRGAVIGKVMSGLLLGILMSRTLSGFIADHWGWRWAFWTFAIGIYVIALLIFARIQETPVKSQQSYFSLLKSLGFYFKKYKSLRIALLTQGLIGMGLTAFWTNLSFYLSNEPFRMSSTQVGLFGLAGAAGALASPLGGKLADKRGPLAGILFGCLACVMAFALMGVFPSSIAILIFGVVVFDMGVQLALISHQSIVYSLNPQARSSLNAIFVTALFASFSIGAAVSVPLFSRWGWKGILSFCLITSSLALLNAVLNKITKPSA